MAQYFENKTEDVEMSVDITKSQAQQFIRKNSLEKPKQLKSVKVNLIQQAPSYLYAWGDNSTYGKLGIDSREERIPRPTLV